MYNTLQRVSNGFVVEIDYETSSCSSTAADGFTFLVSTSLTPATAPLTAGGALAVVNMQNVAVVAFNIYGSGVRVCTAGPSTYLQWTNCDTQSLTVDLSCSGTNRIKIVYTPASTWEVTAANVVQGTFTRDLVNTLSLSSGEYAYVGFTAATGGEYMQQRILGWTFSEILSCSPNNGGCSADATCTVVLLTSINCECNPGFTGDGYTCDPVIPPTDPPVDPPVNPPVDPPVDPPVEPPVEAPVEPPMTPPVAPVAAPVVTPVNPPSAPPVAAPVTAATPTFVPVIIPILECFDDLKNGSYLAYFGYNNTWSSEVSVPVGPLNTFGTPAFLGQPTTFAAGRSDFFPSVAFAYLWDGQAIKWTLTSYGLTVDTSDTSRQCPTFARLSLTFYTSRPLTEQEINAIIASLANAAGISVERITVTSITYTPVSNKRQDLNVAELEMEISGGDGTTDEPNAADAVRELIETAKNGTAMNEILDPNGDLGAEFLGLKSQPTGVEQTGDAAQEPVAGPGSRGPRGLVSRASAVIGAGTVYYLFGLAAILTLSALL